MEKKIYRKPTMQLEEFIPNECVAACGDSGTVYFPFICDAPITGNYHDSDGDWDDVYWWSDSNFNPLNPRTKNRKLEDYIGRNASRLGQYHPCGASHTVSNRSTFYYGFIDRDNDGKYTEGEGVVIWRGDNYWFPNIHCSQQLKHEDWETPKS